MRVSWDREGNGVMKSKLTNQFRKVVSLIQEDFVGVAAAGNSKTYITSGRSASIGEGLIHCVQDVIDIGTL